MVTITEKLKAIKQVENGVLMRNVASNYGGISMIMHWIESISKIIMYSYKIPNLKTIKLADN